MKLYSTKNNSVRVLVMLSGGQDSATLLYWAINRYGRNNVTSAGFNYGQKNLRELYCAKLITDEEKIPFRVFDLSNVFSTGISLNTQDDFNHLDKDNVPSYFVRGRNSVFLSILHSYAQSDQGDADLILAGFNSANEDFYRDWVPNPDCTVSYIESLYKGLDEGSHYSVGIHAPFIRLYKWEIWKVARDLGVINNIIENTHTCYNNYTLRHEWGYGCGECFACKLRESSYVEFLMKG